jgi:hypothetical protein
MGIAASPPVPFRIESATQVLERTPGALRGMLSGLDLTWLNGNCGAETFSPFDVVGHLIHGEKTDWMPRLRLILEHGETVPFEPFDRFAQYAASQGRKIEELLAEFTRLRSANVVKLRAYRFTEAMLALRGKHPELGSVTVRELVATWVVHDLNHIRQIARTMAWQYRDEVGPWKEYLPVLSTK